MDVEDSVPASSGRAGPGRAGPGRASSGRASSGRASPGRASSGRASSGGAPSAGYVVAIDLGTGGPKAAVVSADGRIIASAFEPVGLDLLEGGGAEQDPEEWWRASSSAVREALSRSGVSPGQVAGIGCTAQWSGTVAADAGGNPLRPAVIWMDSRGAGPIGRQMRGTLNVLGYGVTKVQRWLRLTGGAPGHSGKDPVAHILWIREAEPDTYRATHTFLEPVDWLNHRLTGRFVSSHDAITLHWVTDNRRRERIDYDAKLLRAAGLERGKLPDLVPSASLIGGLTERAAMDLGLREGTPVASGTGDVHSAAVGSGAVEDYQAHIYIGTSSWISCHLPFKRTDVMRNVASIPAAIPGRYIVADEHETAGACLTFLKDSLIFGDDGLGAGIPGSGAPADFYARLDQVAASVPPGAGGVIFTPWLNGERSPVDDHTIRAGFHNLSLSTTRSEMVRAVFEGVAYNSRWLLGAVERLARRPFEEITFVGGGARSALWCQIHADVMGRRILQADQPVLANARGAAYLTLLALGRIGVEDIPSMVPIAAVYDPDPENHRSYGASYQEMVNLYRATKAIHRRLNGRPHPGGAASGANAGELTEQERS